jgi:sulfur dioxygenase
MATLIVCILNVLFSRRVARILRSACLSILLLKNSSMVFRQIRNVPTGAYSYVLGDSCNRVGIAVDPIEESQDVLLALIGDLGLDLHLILLTDAHPAACRSAVSLRSRTGASVIAGPDCKHLDVDLQVAHGAYLAFGDEVVHVIGTPGNTRCSVCYRWRDRLFTGATLLIGNCASTSVPCEDPGILFDNVTTRLFTLPPETLVYPGLDANGRTVSTISEEKASNPCFSNRSRDFFVTLMSA